MIPLMVDVLYSFSNYFYFLLFEFKKFYENLDVGNKFDLNSCETTSSNKILSSRVDDGTKANNNKKV